MENKHKKPLKVSNHMQAMVGQPFYAKKPTAKQALNALLDGMARYPGTAWAPMSSASIGGYNLIYCQCPGACGRVWSMNIQDKDIANWLVNEINQRSPYLNPKSKLKGLHAENH